MNTIGASDLLIAPSSKSDHLIVYKHSKNSVSTNNMHDFKKKDISKEKFTFKN